MSADWMSSEEILHESEGGRRVVRIGGEVLRPMYPSSPWVHRLLKFLERVDFSGAPRLVGVRDGVERLAFIDGDAGGSGWEHVLTEDGLASAAQLLRRYHEAVSSFEPPPESVWSSGAQGAPGREQILLHGDPGPWNMIWVDGAATALIDWDHANPGHPLDDLAYLVLYAAPLCSDEEALGWMRHETVPDRQHRLEVLADSYGAAAEGLVARAVEVHAKTTRTVERLAGLGYEPHRSWAENGMLDAFWERHRSVVHHARLLMGA